jgi:hypothetical protein
LTTKKGYKKWSKFIKNKKYKKYFTPGKEKWFNNLNELKQFMNIHHCKPSKQTNKKLYLWLRTQQATYKKKKNIMTDEQIYNEWSKFTSDQHYKKDLMSHGNNDNHIKKWSNKLHLIKNYIKINKKYPNDKKLYDWILTQRKNYKKNIHIMKNDFIKNKWLRFTKFVKKNFKK